MSRPLVFAPRSPVGRVALGGGPTVIRGGRARGVTVIPFFFGPNLGNINGTAAVPITPVPTAGRFIGFGSYSLVGAWPVGLVIDAATGIISGTVAAPTTVGGLRVRLSNASGKIADSNAITVTIV